MTRTLRFAVAYAIIIAAVAVGASYGRNSDQILICAMVLFGLGSLWIMFEFVGLTWGPLKRSFGPRKGGMGQQCGQSAHQD